MAARVLKKPKLTELTGIAELAKAVGIDHSSLSNKEIEAVTLPNWRAWVFTDKQVLYAVEEARGCYVVADKMLSLLNRCQSLKYANYDLACVCFLKQLFFSSS